MYSMDSPYNTGTTSLQSSSEEIDHHQLDQTSFFASDFNTPNQPNLMFLSTNPNITNAPGVTSTRNPKKRSRASRRAPTTVLTTDTSNFRAMVQEFTGVPSPPFNSTITRSSSSSSSPFYPSMSRFLNIEPSAAARSANFQGFASGQNNLGVQLRNDVVPGGGVGGGYGGVDVGLMGLVGSGWNLDGTGGFQAQYGSSDGQRNI